MSEIVEDCFFVAGRTDDFIFGLDGAEYCWKYVCDSSAMSDCEHS